MKTPKIKDTKKDNKNNRDNKTKEIAEKIDVIFKLLDEVQTDVLLLKMEKIKWLVLK